MRKRGVVVAGVALAGVAGAGVVVLANRSDGAAQPAATDAPSATAPVVKTDVSRRQDVTGTLGRSGSYTVISPGAGTLTWQPVVGTVVGRGKPAYEVDGKPVILMFGNRPPWRPMHTGMTDGVDVRQLETNLAALGYGEDLTVDTHFSAATYWAVRHWQAASRLPVTGTVPLGEVVFVTGSVRISNLDVRSGQSVEPGATVEHGTGDQRAINVQVPTSTLARVKVGDTVTVALPDSTRKSGKVTSVGAVTQPDTSGTGSQGGAADSTQPTAAVVITLTGAISNVLENAQVQVGFTMEQHRQVLAVPLPALRPLGAAQFEVLVADGSATRHVPVNVGIFDQVAALVEVSGDGLATGQRVAVPADGR